MIEPEFAIVVICRGTQTELVTERLLPEEHGDWAAAARRACAGRLAPLRCGLDYVAVPVLSQPLRVSTVPIGPALFRAQVFEVRLP